MGWFLAHFFLVVVLFCVGGIFCSINVVVDYYIALVLFHARLEE